MERTQVYFDSAQRKALTIIARRKGATFSALVRDAISAYIAREDIKEPPQPLERIEDHPIWKLLEETWALRDPSDEISDGSTTYKEALYGGDRPWPESS